MLAARRVIRVVPAVTRRALSSAGQGASSSSSSGISAPMLLAGTGVAMGVAAIAASGVVGGGADADAKGSPQLEELTKRLTQLEVDFAGKTNSAFVFVKPHACNKAVIELVKEKLNAAGIRITSEGELSASKIDKDMLIDTHYGAIASKAVKLKPAELNVPAKGQADFQKMFGMSWEDALKKGVVYNAADACTKLGVDASGLDAKWSKLARGTSLLKFGGGLCAPPPARRATATAPASPRRSPARASSKVLSTRAPLPAPRARLAADRPAATAARWTTST